VSIDTTGPDCFHLSEARGLLEMTVDLGEDIATGDLLERIWSTDRAGAPPQEFRSRASGILAARHFPGLMAPSDCLAVVAAVA